MYGTCSCSAHCVHIWYHILLTLCFWKQGSGSTLNSPVKKDSNSWNVCVVMWIHTMPFALIELHMYLSYMVCVLFSCYCFFLQLFVYCVSFVHILYVHFCTFNLYLPVLCCHLMLCHKIKVIIYAIITPSGHYCLLEKEMQIYTDPLWDLTML